MPVIMATTQEVLTAQEAGFDIAAVNPNTKWWHDRVSDIYIPRDPFYLGDGAAHRDAVMPLFLELADKIEVAASDFQQLQTSGPAEQPYIVISPVFAGSLPKESSAALLAGAPLEDLQRTLKQSLPEPDANDKHWILSKKRVEHEKQGWHFSKVINIVFIEDPEQTIEQLYNRESYKNNGSSYEALLALHRHEIAKTGAYKTVLVPYQIKNGRAEAQIATIGTLEGGHPSVDIENVAELTRRLLVLGATHDVEPLRGEGSVPEITAEQWQASSVVEGLVNFFRYSAKQRLIDAPVVLNQLIRNQKQAEKIGRIVDWSQQQESAGLAYDPNLGLWVVTGSGRYGIDKRRLQKSDLTPVWTDTGSLVSGKIAGLNTPRPSVEAQEVLKAQINLQQVFPAYADLGVPVSPIHSTLHLHRGEDTLNRMVKTNTEHTVVKNDVMWLAPGMDDYDHIGCGMEEMDARTDDALRRAYEEWEASSRRADFVLWYVANHGMMAAEFVKEGESFAPFEKIRGAIEKKRISITRSVLQV